MTSLILSAASRLILPLMLLFSVNLLLHGHNEPGGGFVGGLVAAAAFALYAIAFGVARTREALHINTIPVIGIGLLMAFFAGLLLFDSGVYLVVVGVTLTIIFAMAEADAEEDEEEA